MGGVCSPYMAIHLSLCLFRGVDLKNVLILSLGTGNAVYRNMEGDIIDQMYDNNTWFSSYSSVNYKYGDSSPIHAEFMALPLLEMEKPDMVFLIGTMGSVWTALYSRFVTDPAVRSKDHMRKLFEIEKASAHDTPLDVLETSQRAIQQIYDDESH